MRNLIELLNNAVALLFAMRILVVVAMVILAARLAYTYFHHTETKRFWNDRKKDIGKHRGVLKNGNQRPRQTFQH